MLLSMTGYGESRAQVDSLAIGVEVRAVNSRFLKLLIRTPDAYGSLEGDIEKVVRKQVRRGTVQVNLRVDRGRSAEDFRINEMALASYQKQIERIEAEGQIPGNINLADLLALPGVVEETFRGPDEVSSDWPAIRETLDKALGQFGDMRRTEGAAMEQDLLTNCAQIEASIDSIAKRAPLVVDAYRERLSEKLNRVLGEYDVKLDPVEIIREVSIFAERGDISEELVRLASHLTQFREALSAAQSEGRKLEFVVQEMLRETNTIGSKSNDVEITQHVITIKAAIEKIREMIQNVE